MAGTPRLHPWEFALFHLGNNLVGDLLIQVLAWCLLLSIGLFHVGSFPLLPAIHPGSGVGGEQQGEGALWRVASRDHGNPGEQRENWTARRNDWRAGDDEERSQANKTGFTKPQASPVAARHSGTTPESRPHRTRCGQTKPRMK